MTKPELEMWTRNLLNLPSDYKFFHQKVSELVQPNKLYADEVYWIMAQKLIDYLAD